MRNPQKLFALLPMLALGLGVATHLPAAAQAAAATSAPAAVTAPAQPLTILQVHERLEAAGYRNIRKIEAERSRYEVYATDREGRRVELFVDSITGKIEHYELKSRYDDRRCDDRRCGN